MMLRHSATATATATTTTTTTTPAATTTTTACDYYCYYCYCYYWQKPQKPILDPSHSSCQSTEGVEVARGKRRPELRGSKRQGSGLRLQG